jgi:hypothetical protein
MVYLSGYLYYETLKKYVWSPGQVSSLSLVKSSGGAATLKPSGQAWDMAFPPYLLKLLYCRDSVVRASWWNTTTNSVECNIQLKQRR